MLKSFRTTALDPFELLLVSTIQKAREPRVAGGEGLFPWYYSSFISRKRHIFRSGRIWAYLQQLKACFIRATLRCEG